MSERASERKSEAVRQGVDCDLAQQAHLRPSDLSRHHHRLLSHLSDLQQHHFQRAPDPHCIKPSTDVVDCPLLTVQCIAVSPLQPHQE